MLKLELLSSISLQLNTIDYSASNAVRYEKLILAEVKLSDRYEIQDAMNLLEFLKAYKPHYQQLFSDPNLNAILYSDVESYSENHMYDKALYEEDFITILSSYFSSNFKQFYWACFEKCSWDKLSHFLTQGEAILPNQIPDFVLMELDNSLDLITSSFKSKNFVLSSIDYKNHYSTQKKFYLFLLEYRTTHFDDKILEITTEAAQKTLSSNNTEFIEYAKGVFYSSKFVLKKLNLFFKKHKFLLFLFIHFFGVIIFLKKVFLKTNEPKTKDRVKNIFSLFAFLTIGYFTYYFGAVSNMFFWSFAVSGVIILLAYNPFKFISEEKEKLKKEDEISTIYNQSTWTLRRLVLYSFILFLMSIIGFLICFVFYYLFRFLGTALSILLIVGTIFFIGSKKEKKDEERMDNFLKGKE